LAHEDLVRQVGPLMDQVIPALVAILQLAMVGAVVFFIWWARKRSAVWPDVPENTPLSHESDGARAVPVRQLTNRGFMSQTKNGMSPKLWLTSTGLRVKVFKTVDRPFDWIRRVDVYRPLLMGGARVLFHGPGAREMVIADIRDTGAARTVLRSLPSNIPLTERALALRGISQSAATTGAPPPPSVALPTPVEDGGGNPTLATTAFAVALLFAVYMSWGAVQYSGFYRLLAEWQIAHFGSYAWGLTWVIPITLLSSPLATIGIVKSPNGQSGPGCLMLIGLFGVILLVIGGGMIMRARGLPTLSDPVQVVDVAQIGDANPPSAHVKLVGHTDNARTLAIRKRGKTGWTEYSYLPVTPKGVANPSTPVRYVIDQMRLDPQGAPIGMLDDVEGVLAPNALPGEARVGFNRAGVILAEKVAVLDPSGIDARFDDYVYGGLCVLGGLACLGLLGLGARAPLKLV
jgi:hypothetical protein